LLLWWRQTPRDAVAYLKVGLDTAAVGILVETAFFLWHFAAVPLHEAVESNDRLTAENVRLRAENAELASANARREPPRRYPLDEQVGVAHQCLRTMAQRRTDAGSQRTSFCLIYCRPIRCYLDRRW